MGFFDFFKRRSRPTPLDTLEDEGPSPRYVLAHYALRQVALASPLQYLGILADDVHKVPFIASIMEDVSQKLNCNMDFSPQDIKVHPCRVGDYPCAILEFPAPREMAEAYFTALIGMIDVRDESPSNPEEVPARYFTLEKGVNLEDNSPRTVLCEWDESSHSNYGDGPEPTVEAFALAIKEVLK